MLIVVKLFVIYWVYIADCAFVLLKNRFIWKKKKKEKL